MQTDYTHPQLRLSLQKYAELFGGVYRVWLDDMEEDNTSNRNFVKIVDGSPFFLSATKALDNVMCTLGMHHLSTEYRIWINSLVLTVLSKDVQNNLFTSACKFGYLNIVECLIDNFSMKPLEHEWSLFALSCMKHDTKLLEKLFTDMLPDNMQKDAKHELLRNAINTNNQDIVRWLLNREYITWNLKDLHTGMSMAWSRGYRQIVDLIRDHNPSVITEHVNECRNLIGSGQFNVSYFAMIESCYFNELAWGITIKPIVGKVLLEQCTFMESDKEYLRSKGYF